MKTNRWSAIGAAILLVGLNASCATRRTLTPMETGVGSQPLSIVPYPQQVRRHNGYLTLDSATRVVVATNAGADLRNAVAAWTSQLRADWGLPLTAAGAGSAIEFRLDPALGLPAEGYQLNVSAGGATVSASADAGLFYGLQTLRQMLPIRAANTRPVIPMVEIQDAPRFVYRGMHLDVGRHFFPISFVKKYIDLMSQFKLNTFHWHLTEDQGWRLEINRYPRLTTIGSCRTETAVRKNFNPFIGDGKPHCGFYTQAEAREIVEYARQRFITVLPEIEMPGHATAALAAYPELACSPGPFEVAKTWGIFEDIFCPSEETFTFLQNVLTEVMAIFPSRYIHIGGDEAPKKRWQESELAQSVMRREGLKDEHELQSYFVRRIEKFLNANGRRLIGWDEILEGGIAPDATVMSWRGIKGGIEAARQGHDVIMTPTDYVYLDYYQGDPKTEPFAIGGNLPIEKVYSFEPVPSELTAEEARHILGAQANVWTEYMPTSSQVEYMVFPRLLALAEIAWSPKEAKNWKGFEARLPWQKRLLERQGVNFRP
jgi:hexosaminidase